VTDELILHDRFAEYVGEATWFISHTWSSVFADTLDAIILFLQAREDAVSRERAELADACAELKAELGRAREEAAAHQYQVQIQVCSTARVMLSCSASVCKDCAQVIACA
jgi:hypothetical protein